MSNKVDNLVVENARIIFRNFAGKEKKYNPEGDRNFCLLIDDDNVAASLADKGWNVKTLQPRNPDDGVAYYIPVRVSYEYFPPNIYLMSGQYVDEKGQVRFRNKVHLDEESVGSLDYAEIENVDLIIRPYQWEVNGKTGIKAYAHRMYVTIAEDEFAAKYEVDERPDEVPFD